MESLGIYKAEEIKEIANKKLQTIKDETIENINIRLKDAAENGLRNICVKDINPYIRKEIILMLEGCGYDLALKGLDENTLKISWE